MNNEKKVDELLEALANELTKERIEKFELFDKISEPKKENIQIKRKHFTRLIWIAVLLICIITFSTITVTSEALRATLFSFFFSEEEGYDNVIDENSFNKNAKNYYPAYLPKGYIQISDDDFGTMHTTVYKNNINEEIISINQVNDKYFSMAIDTDTSQKKQCIVKTGEAWYIEGNENHILIWEENDIYFEIISSLAQNELIKIANSMK